MLPKVSVIVPIYNVEKYIHQCIDSIVNQTYENLEIILVDDGTPDNCGEIAEEYCIKDNRVKVIHKENGGLSDARNYGMKSATGEYTVFVDSDDWLEYSMIETLVNAAIKDDSDVVQSGFYYAYEDCLLFDNRYYKGDTPVMLANKTLMKELVINEKIKNFAWGKLYKTSIIRDISFKKGVLFEDVFWAHKVMQKVDKFVILNKPMCYYRQRNDSISGKYDVRNLNIIEGLIERHNFIEKHYKELRYDSYKIIFKTCLTHYELLEKNSHIDSDKKYRKKINGYITKNYNEIKKSVSNDKQLKINLKIFMFNSSLVRLNRYINKALKVIKIIPTERSLKRIEING